MYSSYAVYAERDKYIGEWKRLPPGVVFHPSYKPPNDPPAEPRNLFLNSEAQYGVNVPFPYIGNPNSSVYAFTFRPDGRLDVALYNRKSIFITEGWIDDGETVPNYRPDAKIFGIEIQPVTGKTKVR